MNVRYALAVLVAMVAAAEAAPNKPVWPSSREGLVFLWQNGNRVKSPAVAYDKAGDPIYAYALTARGNAIFGGNYEMILRGGSFHAPGVGTHVSQSLAKSNALTLEAYVRVPATPPATLTPLLSYSTGTQDVRLAIAQKGDALFLGQSPLVTLPAKRAFHLAVRCEPGAVIAYVDGAEAGRLKESVDFTGWKPAELVFGDGWEATQNWPGRLEGVALYNRTLPAAEIARNAAAYAAIVAARPVVPAVRMRGKLVQRSESTVKIDPYFRALALFEYEVEKLHSGKYEHPKVYVFTWTVMHKTLLPVASRPLLEEYELYLEPFDAHPELESELQLDTLDRTYDRPVYYQVEDE